MYLSLVKDHHTFLHLTGAFKPGKINNVQVELHSKLKVDNIILRDSCNMRCMLYVMQIYYLTCHVKTQHTHSKRHEVITGQKISLIPSKRLLHFNSNYKPLKQAESLRVPDLCQTGSILLFPL